MKKDIVVKLGLALAALLALGIALCAAYVSGQESGLTAPGAEVIECPAEGPETDSTAVHSTAVPDVPAAARDMLKGSAAPVFESTFMGGYLQAYEYADGLLCICDPDPTADSIYTKLLFGPYEISAEEYVALNGGPGIYESYDAERKALVSAWGEDYATVTQYRHVLPVYLMDAEIASVVWYMTAAEFETFWAEGTLRLSEGSTDMPSLAAALD